VLAVYSTRPIPDQTAPEPERLRPAGCLCLSGWVYRDDWLV